MTAANADKWIPINPGSEGYAAMALAWAIASTHPESSAVARITGEAGPGALREFQPDALVEVLGIPSEVLDGKNLREFFEELAHDYMAHGGLAIGGGGEAGAYSNGQFNASAVLMLNYIIGNVGRKGGLLPDPGSPISDSPTAAPVASLEPTGNRSPATSAAEPRPWSSSTTPTRCTACRPAWAWKPRWPTRAWW